MKIIKHIPNILTVLRLFCAASLLFLKPLADPFMILYIAGGVTDLLDGFIARTAKCTTEFGAKLDSAADMSFYLVMLVTLLPEIYARLPWQIWIYVGIILLVRLSSYLAVAFRHHKFASLHTYLNKITGFSLYIVPFVMTYAYSAPYFFPYCVVLCTIALLASGEELIMHIRESEYDSDKKSIINSDAEEA